MYNSEIFLEKAKRIFERSRSRREVEEDLIATFRKHNFHRGFPLGNECKTYFRQQYAHKPKDWYKYNFRITDYAHLTQIFIYANGVESIVEVTVQDVYCEKSSPIHYYNPNSG